MNLGTLLRKHRKNNKLTLRAVAEKAGGSEGFISQVENNVKAPSLSTLMNICEAIGADAGGLLQQLKNQERLFLIQRNEWDDVDIPHTGFVTRRFCTPESRTLIDTAILIMESRKSIPVRKDIKNGQELLCVLRGKVELVHEDRRVVLNEGDAVHVWTDPKNQQVTNMGDDRAILLWVGTI